MNKPKTSQNRLKGGPEKFKLFIGSIPGDAKKGDLLSFFSSHGTVLDITIPKKATSNVNAGYCLLTCADKNTYNHLLTITIYYGQRRLEIRPHLTDRALTKFRSEYNKRRVYIHKFKETLKDHEVKSLFEEAFGPVESAYIIKNDKNHTNSPSKLPKFGYVLFQHEQDALRALNSGILKKDELIIYIQHYAVKNKEKEPDNKQNCKNPIQISSKSKNKTLKFENSPLLQNNVLNTVSKRVQNMDSSNKSQTYVKPQDQNQNLAQNLRYSEFGTNLNPQPLNIHSRTNPQALNNHLRTEPLLLSSKYEILKNAQSHINLDHLNESIKKKVHGKTLIHILSKTKLEAVSRNHPQDNLFFHRIK